MKAPGEELQRNLESIQLFKQFFPFLCFWWAIFIFLNPDPDSDTGPEFRVRTQVHNPYPDLLAKQDPDTLTHYWFLSEDLDLTLDRECRSETSVETF